MLRCFIALVLFCLVVRVPLQAQPLNTQAPVLLGGYPSESPWLGDDQGVKAQFRNWDEWAGKRMSIAGTFYDIEWPRPQDNLYLQLKWLGNNDYTPFVNLTSLHSSLQIAEGVADDAIQNVAQAYSLWVNEGTGRRAFIAPLPEMNDPFSKYGGDPVNFQKAFRHLQGIFARAGVGADNVRWVFAPNGWSASEANNFEKYYPRDAVVDVVGFSAYNWAYWKDKTGKFHDKWEEPKDLFNPFIERMKTMAPDKPIFIAQTATTSQRLAGQTPTHRPDAKKKWLRDAYQYWATAGVRAILYFNYDKPSERDWAVFNSTIPEVSYQETIAQSLAGQPAFDYVPPTDLAQMNLAP